MPDRVFEKSKREVGYVVSSQDYLVNLEGLPSARINDIVMTKNGGRAMISALSRNTVEALMLDPERPKPGDFFELASEGLSLPVDMNLFGRVINPMGIPLDGKAGLPPKGETLDLDLVAPGIDAREVIRRQFYTGITLVDTLLPLGRGQRELILCEPRSGKEMFFLDVICSQKNKGVVCIYAAIGRSEVEVKRFSEEIEKNGAAGYTIIIAATSNESAPMITITPSVASSLAEHYRDQGKDVLLIHDDLATHAKYAREISLLAGRVPGRESYPADIFYQHSSMLERGGSFNEHFKGGAITLFPTIETNIENFTNLIPTNVMSITDGHILFSAALRATGVYPAIQPDRSVTRVGRQTQMFIHKQISDKVRSLLADFHELEKYARFGSELSKETQNKIKRGKVFEELLKQEPLVSVPPGVQIMILAMVFNGFFDQMEIELVRTNKRKIMDVLGANSPFKETGENIKDIKFEALLEFLKTNAKTLEDACQQSKN
jgi:F-type H+/Na+-transporting ATPase subunit alpha